MKIDAEYIAELVAKTETNEKGCWIWTGNAGQPPRDYGYMTYRKRSWRVHRLSYALHKGPIPEGMVVCHTCDTPRCCNPDHLWIGTQDDNLADMRARNGHYLSNKTVCKRGHEFTPDNTWTDSTGRRHCRICARARLRVRDCGWTWEEALADSAPVPHGAITKRRRYGRKNNPQDSHVDLAGRTLGKSAQDLEP